MHICRYFHDDTLPRDLRRELEDSVYQSFVEDRPSVEDRRPTAPPTGEAPTIEPLKQTVDRITRTLTFKDMTAGNERLSERIAHEAIHWIGARWSELETSDPFADEEAALDGLTAEDATNVESVAETVLRHRPELSELVGLVRRNALDDAVATTGTTDTEDADGAWALRRQLDREARVGMLRRRWRGRIERDRAHHRTRVLGRALGAFVRDLESLIPQLAKEQELVRDALGNEDALWDLTRHEWEELPAAGLQEAARMLRDHPEIERLAKELGRSKSVTEQQTVETVERRVRLRAVGAGKSEVTGIRAGDDVTSLLASEVALLAEPETEDLFFAKLAHRELLVLDYSRQELVEDVTLHRVHQAMEVPVERGPAIVCVDTSGSMLGLPERVTKATVLALARRLAEDKRRVEVLAFASDVRSFTLDHERTNLMDLARFLEGGFHGGTDLTRALGAALGMLRTQELRNADVLVISDFRVPKIADRYMDQINRQHRRGTLFHSLTVARRPVIDPLHIFDSAWLFSTESGRITPDSLRAIP